MIKLIIYHADGSIYWIEHFNDMDSCDRWLKEEKTRPYWKEDFTTEIKSEEENVG